jgi:DNA-binding MltR family transcriptional regulator
MEFLNLLEIKRTMTENKGDRSKWDNFISQFSAFIRMLGHESERGSVIVGVALMDEALESLLKKKLVPSPEKSDELFKGPYAPLDNFSAKIDLAYRLGLIGLNQRSTLHIMRKLRNDFAHSSSQLNFQSEQVHGRILELFKLNKHQLDAVWDAVNKKENTEVAELIGNYQSKHGVDCLTKILGWRTTFELLCSLIAVALNTWHDDVEPLVTRGSNIEKN